MFRVYAMDIALGRASPLPDYIQNNKKISKLKYDDNLCFWRCLAMKQGARSDRATGLAKKLYKSYYEKKYTKAYPGVYSKTEFDAIEEKFHVALNIFSWDSKAISFEINSITDYEPLYMLTHEAHLMHVKDPASLSKKCTCTKCDQIYASHYQLKRHFQNCKGIVRDSFPKRSEVYKPCDNFILGFMEKYDYWLEAMAYEKKMTEAGTPTKFWSHDYWIVYDFESYMTAIEQKDQKDNKTKKIKTHMPLSCSIYSNTGRPVKFMCVDSYESNEALLATSLLSSANVLKLHKLK
jgi:hypothetical protein